MRIPIHSSKKEEGQSIIELAISMIFVLIVLMSVLDLGRAFYIWIELRDAAQEAASYGSYSPVCSDAVNRAKDASNSPINFNSSTNVNISCTFPDGLSCAGHPIKVVATYNNFRIVTPFIGTLVGSQDLNINASVIDTILKPECP